jgi:hypothetical protein
VLDLNRIAEDVGVDVASILTSAFVNSREDELFQHFTAIADGTRLPVLLYHNPGRTGVNLSAGLVARLAEHPNIVGIKDLSCGLSLTCEMIRQIGDDFKVLMGRDSLTYAGLHHGPAGGHRRHGECFSRSGGGDLRSLSGGGSGALPQSPGKAGSSAPVFQFGQLPSCSQGRDEYDRSACRSTPATDSFPGR